MYDVVNIWNLCGYVVVMFVVVVDLLRVAWMHDDYVVQNIIKKFDSITLLINILVVGKYAYYIYLPLLTNIIS